jgi:hypothetical protein
VFDGEEAAKPNEVFRRANVGKNGSEFERVGSGVKNDSDPAVKPSRSEGGPPELQRAFPPLSKRGTGPTVATWISRYHRWHLFSFPSS